MYTFIAFQNPRRASKTDPDPQPQKGLVWNHPSDGKGRCSQRWFYNPKNTIKLSFDWEGSWGSMDIKPFKLGK